MVDCDPYSSARTALDFCGPLIRDRAVVLFDDWPIGTLASKRIGERRECEEFLVENPDLAADELDSNSPRAKAFLVTRTGTETPETGSARA